MIRRALLDDIPQLIRLANAMQEEAGAHYRAMLLDEDRIANIVMSSLRPAAPTLVNVHVTDDTVDGFMASGVAPDPIYQALYGYEYALYVAPERRGHGDGVRLAKRAEEWARQRGAVYMQVAVTGQIMDSIADRVYEELGFKAIGTIYHKEF